MARIRTLAILLCAAVGGVVSVTRCQKPGEAQAGAVQGQAVQPRGEGAAVRHPRRALLVGVGRYHPDSQRKLDGTRVFGDLDGAPYDMQLVRDLLIQRFDFREEEIKVLTNEVATLENVVKTFHEHLVLGSTPDTEVLFWYSGHGSTVRDTSGGENTRIDSTFVLYDSRADGHTGDRDLPDDALHSLVAALPTKRVTVITDSCHSGGGMRGGEVRIKPRPGIELAKMRFAPEGQPAPSPESWSFWPADVPFLDDADPRRDPDLSYVHVAACADTQQAWEVELDKEPDGYESKTFGALTWHMVHQLAQAPPGTTWRTIAGRVRLLVSSLMPDQSVALEGRGADRIVFGEEVSEALHGFSANPTSNGTIRVEAGGLCGYHVGAELAVYKLGEYDKPLGRARITRSWALKAVAEWLDGEQDLPETEPLKVVLRSLGDDEKALSVRVPDAKVAAEIAEENICWLLPITDPEVECEYVFAQEDGRWTLRTAEGATVWRAEDEQSLAEQLPYLALAARDEVQFRRIWDLAAAAGKGALKVEAEFFTPTPEERKDPRFQRDLDGWGLTEFRSVTLPDSQDGKSYPLALRSFDAQVGGAGDFLGLRITPSRELHVVILNMDEAQRMVKLNWGDEPDNRVLPDSPLERMFWVGAPERTEWPSGEPCIDRYLVIVTKKHVDLSPLVTERARTRGPAAPDVLRDLSGFDWGVAVVDLVIRRVE